jgi:hypothetical protein
MNSPAPGWHPDPTARHDYRYWDGWEWTDDVADGGLTAFDPLPADDGRASHGHAADPYGSYDPYGYDPRDPYGYGARPATRRGPDLDYRSDYQSPAYAGGGESTAKKGPSTRLLVGLGLVAVAMIAGLGFFLVSSGDGDQQADGTEISDRRGDRPAGGSTNAGDPSTSSETTASTGTTSTTAGPATTAPPPGGGPATTAPPGGPGTTAPPAGGGGGGGGSGDEAAVIDDLAQMFHTSSGGAMSEDQSRCMAQGMVDTVGVEGARALTGGAGGLPPSLTPEQQQELQSLAMDCGMGG